MNYDDTLLEQKDKSNEEEDKLVNTNSKDDITIQLARKGKEKKGSLATDNNPQMI